MSDGVDQCLVGYLHHHQVKHLNKLEGALCQVTEVYSDNSDSPTNTRRTLVVQLRLLYQVMNPTKLGMEETNYKVLPKLLQMWIHLQHQFDITEAKEIPWTWNRKEQTYKE